MIRIIIIFIFLFNRMKKHKYFRTTYAIYSIECDGHCVFHWKSFKSTMLYNNMHMYILNIIL